MIACYMWNKQNKHERKVSANIPFHRIEELLSKVYNICFKGKNILFRIKQFFINTQQLINPPKIRIHINRIRYLILSWRGNIIVENLGWKKVRIWINDTQFRIFTLIIWEFPITYYKKYELKVYTYIFWSITSKCYKNSIFEKNHIF